MSSLKLVVAPPGLAAVASKPLVPAESPFFAADQTMYSNDGVFLAVHNSTGGLGYRVLRASDGVFLGRLTATIDPDAE